MRMRVGLVLLVAALAVPSSAAATTVTDGAEGANPGVMANTIIGSGIDFTVAAQGSAEISSGAPVPNTAYGTFSGAPTALGITSGVVLTTGDADIMQIFNDPGYADPWSVDGTDGALDADWLAANGNAPAPATDLTRLRMTFRPVGPELNVTYLFGSEEFGEVTNQKDDGALILLDSAGEGNPADKNCALLPGDAPVSVSNIDTNADWFELDSGGSASGLDGRITPQQCTFNVVPGEIVALRFVVFERFDHQFDSALVLGADSLTSDAVPEAALAASPDSGAAPLDVSFSTAGSDDLEGPLAEWTLEFGDGTSQTDAGDPPASIAHTYAAQGTHLAKLTVIDTYGQEAEASKSITVGPPSTEECEDAKDALAAAKRKLRKAKKRLNAAEDGGTKSEIRDAEAKVKKAKQRVRRAQRSVDELCE